jgi:cohesin complex subunit SA-1/2
MKRWKLASGSRTEVRACMVVPNNTVQISAEERKKATAGRGGAVASNPRLTSLRAAIDTLNTRIQALETLMKQVFNGVFVQRYRDIDEHIRIECVQAVGRW